MGFLVPISVQFEVQDPALLQDLARKHSSLVARHDRRSVWHNADAIRMLDHAAEGRGVATGHKGSMFTWGVVGNYAEVRPFVEALRPFCADLYREQAVWRADGIIVMAQKEQQVKSTVIEICCDWTNPPPKSDRNRVTLVVRTRETTFPLIENHFDRPDEMLPPGVETTRWEDA